MNRAGLLAAAGGAVAIGLAPVVPLAAGARSPPPSRCPDVHFYAVSATALAVRGARAGARRARRAPPRPAHGRHRRGLHGHGRAARGARPDHARLPDRGRVHRRGRRLGRARRAARRRRDPGRAALAAARARLRARPRRCCRSASSWRVLAFGALALLEPAAIPSIPVALRPLVWWIVGANALIYGVLALRALRTFQLTRRLGDLAVAAGLVWLAIAVATYLLSPVWSVGFWGGHVLELGAFLVVTAALVSDLARATPVARAALRDRRPRRRDRAGGAARRLGRRACSRGSRSRTPRRASTPGASRSSPSRSGRSSGCAATRLRGLAVAALLHDVGKLQVPDAILCKAGPLTPAEFAVIKRHPGDGAALLDAHRRLRRGGAARARASRAPRRQRLPRRPARRRALARGAHPRRLRRLRRAHERARLPPRLHASRRRSRSSTRAAGARSTRTCSTRSRAWSAAPPSIPLQQAA